MNRRQMVSNLATLVVHTIGVGVIFTATIWTHGSEAAGEAAATAWEWGLLFNNANEYLLQVGLSACLWALAVIVFKLVAIAHRDARAEKLKPTRIALKARGTVLTESLIVLPVFLLLTLGLIQLTLNNTAAIFTSLAAFQSGRTVHLWAPENSGSSWARNGGVSSDNIQERARVAAASVLAPVAPSQYLDGSCSTSSLFNNKLEAMMSVTLGAAGSLGSASAGTVRALAMGREMSTRNNLTVTKAFDSDKFAVRAPIKLLIAYCHTAAEVRTTNGMHAVTVTFSHKQAMPLVGRIFGSVIKTSGRYNNVVRTYNIPQQISPNPAHPTSFFSILNFNPFSGIN